VDEGHAHDCRQRRRARLLQSLHVRLAIARRFALMQRWLPRIIGTLLMASALALALSHAPDRSVQSLVARWALPPSEFIDLDGQLVHLRDVGPRHDAAPIVLVHGTSASLHTWEGWVAALSAQHRVISFDLPGFGLTGPFAGRFAQWSYRGDELARFTLELLDHLKVQRFAIAGNSLGGEVAWRVASLAPARVRHLVLIDSAGYELAPASVPLGFRLASVPGVNRLFEWLLPRGVVEASVRDVYGDPGKVTPPLIDRYFELTLREGNRAALVQRLQAQAIDQQRVADNVARLRALQVPTLVMWGSADRLIPVAFAQRFGGDIAGSRLAVFDGLGHVPQEEDPATTVAAVKAFLTDKIDSP
jgi:pimeloyl-ACP methyl ester carboxylesterase